MKRIILAFMSVLLTVCIFFSITVSAAATEETYTFIVPGDVDCNKFLEIKDVTLMQKHLASVENITEAGLSVADYNGDGNSNIFDATEMQKCLAGLEYDCIIRPEEYVFAKYNYFPTDLTNCEIEYKELINCNDLFYYGPKDSLRDINTGISFITTKEQFFAFIGAYSPEFDDEFFKDYALIIWVEKEGKFDKKKWVENIYVKDNQIYFSAVHYTPSYISTENSIGYNFYILNKTDVNNVNSIKLEIIEAEDP